MFLFTRIICAGSNDVDIVLSSVLLFTLFKVYIIMYYLLFCVLTLVYILYLRIV
jgi:hypothetical protein